MHSNNNSFLKHIDFFIVDTITLIVSFLIAYLIRSNSADFIDSNLYIHVLMWMLVPNLFYYILFNPYSNVLKRSKVDEIKLSIIQAFYSFLFVTVMLFILQSGNLFSRLILGYTFVIYAFLSIVTRIIWKSMINKGIIKTNKENDINLMIIGSIDNMNNIITNIGNSDFNRHNIKCLYFVDDSSKKTYRKIKVITDEKDIQPYVVTNNINTVFVTSDLNKKEKKVIKQLINEGIAIQVFIDSLYNVEAEEKTISNIGMYNTLQLNSYVFTANQQFYFFFKRIADVVFSLFGCIIMVVLCVILKILFLLSGDKEPIIYTQRRVGLNGKEFDLYKFRSMVPNADDMLKELLKDEKIRKQWSKNQKIDNDPRITKLGMFLRKTSIDEVPQFINVLKADMSIIGPRPLVPGELESKNGIKLYERVRPGITGWWACNGRSDMSYEERLEHEYYYVRNCSLDMDILCIIRTIYVVLFGKGAR